MTMASRTIRPILSLMVLAGMGLLIWAGAIRPVSDWRSNRYEQRGTLQADVLRLGHSVSQLEAEYAALSQQETLDLIWSAGGIGEVTAQVQASISTTAREAGVALRSISPGGARDLPLFDAVGFRLEGEVRLDQ